MGLISGKRDGNVKLQRRRQRRRPIVAAIYQNSVYVAASRGKLRQLCGRQGRGGLRLALASNRLLLLCCTLRRAAQFIIACRALTQRHLNISINGGMLHFTFMFLPTSLTDSLSLTHSLCLSSLAVARLDKEFVGPFGLMLPDVTQLPATFDVLLANLQVS